MPVVLTEGVPLARLQALSQLFHLNVGGVVGLGAVIVNLCPLRHWWEGHGRYGNCAGTGVATMLDFVVTRHFGKHFAVILRMNNRLNKCN